MKKKKSDINNWWIAQEDKKMCFYNILNGKPLQNNLYVVGYFKETTELYISTNFVVKITHEGIFTAKGTFYPFEEAHDLYLSFLIEVNKPNTIFAYNWNYANSFLKSKITADIVDNGIVRENVTFNFKSNKLYSVTFAGYSDTLNSNVVFAPFYRRNSCIILAIPDYIKQDIYYSSFFILEEKRKKVKQLKKLLSAV